MVSCSVTNKQSNMIYQRQIMVNQRNPPSSKSSQEIKFSRKSDKHKTVSNSSIKFKQQLDSKNEKLHQPSLDTIGETIVQKPIKYQRKGHRSISLIEKNKLGSDIFKEELKLKVTINALIEETNGLPTKKYKVISRLGDGSYGTVYLAMNLFTRTNVAMKKINKVKENEIDEMEIKNEIDILKKLDHPNIVKILEFYSTEKAYYIITDYCSCGELYNQIKHQYTENQLAVLFYQLFSGLCYLHANNIVHRDLKLENILISEIERDKETNKNLFWIKIIDFGTAKIFEKNKSEKAVVGSSYYIAPEVLQKHYNEKCDTWSAGVILYMLIVGRAPFDGKDDDEIIENISKGEFNSKHRKLVSASNEVQDLVKKLLEVDPVQRLSAAQALKHPWFTKFKAKSLYNNIEKEKIEMYLNRLMTYTINSKFQQMVLAFIVHNIAYSEDTKNILKIFRMFNEKDDGKLTKGELTKGLCQYVDENKVKNEIDGIFLMLDGANHGYIEYEEFLRACLDKNTILDDEHILYAFNFFDKDNKGRISVDKIKKNFVGSNVKQEVFNNIFKEVDINEDGEIDFVEFKQMMLD